MEPQNKYLETSTNNNQIYIDDINKSIRLEKKKIKKADTFLQVLTNFLSRISNSDLKRKLRRYESASNISINYNTVISCLRYDANCNSLNYSGIRPNNREYLLNEIKLTLNSLIEEYDESLALKLKGLENQFTSLEFKINPVSISRLDDDFLFILEDIREYKENLHSHLNKLRSKLIILCSNKSISLKRDIRKSYRNIIHFIFKNMNDQSGDDNNLFFQQFQNTNYYTLNHVIHEQKLNYRTIRIYYK